MTDPQAPLQVERLELAWWEVEVCIAFVCPVCGAFFGGKTTIAGAELHSTCVAVSRDWIREDGEPVYLRTCGRHSLSDVFDRIHRRNVCAA